jgi:hypothetical protein
MHTFAVLKGTVGRISLALLMIACCTAFREPDSILAPRPVYAASQILCVNKGGGATTAPCVNTTAYTTIQAAVDAASADDEIRLAAGTYSGVGSSDVNINTALTISGGYTSSNWSNPTATTDTVIDGGNLQPGFEIFFVDVTMRRLRITHGRNSGSSGGGITANLGGNHTLTLIDCVVVANSAQSSGGGVFAVGGSAILTRTQIISNTAGEDGGGFYGLQLTMTDSLIAGNVATRHAGGLHATFTALTRTRIQANIAGGDGGGIAANSSELGNTIVLTSSQVISNTAGGSGGGIFLSAYEGNRLTNSVLADNRAQTAGDQLFIYGDDFAQQVSLSNMTIASARLSPHAAIEIGGLTPNSASLSLVNTAVTSHTIGIARSDGTSLRGDYNAFFGNTTNQRVGLISTTLPFTHVVSLNPRFVDPIDHDYHLQTTSPLIDAGDPSRNYNGQRDIDNELLPEGKQADIGADEQYSHDRELYLPLVRR